MASIIGVEACTVDLKPKVKRTDAIQSFESQQTPIVRITDADGISGIIAMCPLLLVKACTQFLSSRIIYMQAQHR